MSDHVPSEKKKVRLQVLFESASSIIGIRMLVASGKKHTCSLSPTLAYRMVTFIHLQYTASVKELLTRGAEDLVQCYTFQIS